MLIVRRGGCFGGGCGGFLLMIVAVVVLLNLAGGGGGGVGGGNGGFGGVNSPFDPYPTTQGPGPDAGSVSVPGAPNPERQGQVTDFVRFVAADLQTFWERELALAGGDYDPTQVVTFRGAVRTGCGDATADTGPFYCPLDRSVYLDLGFFRQLAQRFRAPGDFAQAYVIAHEVGHHVQTLTGVTQQVDAAVQADPSRANELSVRQELMADCLAGVWAHSTYERGLLERGDLQEGLTAAAAVGDDRIQAETTGRIRPETFTHGTSEQRRRWFLAGFQQGKPAACDTFGASQV